MLLTLYSRQHREVINQVLRYRKRSSKLKTEIKVNQTLTLLTGLFWENDLFKTIIRLVRFTGIPLVWLTATGFFDSFALFATADFLTTSAQVTLFLSPTVPSCSVTMPTTPVAVCPWLTDRLSLTRSTTEVAGLNARVSTCACPNSTALNLRNKCPCKGLVKNPLTWRVSDSGVWWCSRPSTDPWSKNIGCWCVETSVPRKYVHSSPTL